jgi:hypothetical protein
MTTETVFTSRLTGRRLLDSDGLVIGRIKDVVLVPASGEDPPRAIGLVVTLHRRQIFVSLSRVAEMSLDGVSLEGSSVDLGRFSRRVGEILASELYDRRVDGDIVLDVGIARSADRVGWEVSALAMGQRRGLLRQPSEVVPWSKHRELFDSGVSSSERSDCRAGRDRLSAGTKAPARDVVPGGSWVGVSGSLRHAVT